MQLIEKAKLQSFQIRINLESIITQLKFHGFEFVDDKLCKICKRESETLMVVFVNMKL